MRPEVLAALYDGGIPFLGGVYATLLGFRILGKSPGVDPKYDAWYDRFGGLLKVVGPLLAIFGVFLAVKDMLVSH